jgi:hypothetical protein
MVYLASALRPVAESDVDRGVPVFFNQADDPRCCLLDSVQGGHQQFGVSAVQADVLAAQSLSVNSMSFTNNKRHGLGFGFDQPAVLADFVPGHVSVEKLVSQLMGQYSKPHRCTESFLDDNMATQ